MHLKGVIVRRADGSLSRGGRGDSPTFGFRVVHVGLWSGVNEIELPHFLSFIQSKLKRTLVLFLLGSLWVN